MVTMNEAAKRLPRPRGAKPVSRSTLWRWTYSGLKAKDGQIIRLDTVRIGGAVYTSIEAMRSFFNRLQVHDGPASAEAHGGFHQSAVAHAELPARSHQTPERRRQLEEVSQKLEFKFFGSSRQIDECGFSEETLREVFDRLRLKLPTALVVHKVYDTVRRAVFSRAVEVLQGLHGTPKGVKAAKSWIDSLDPTTFDVRQLKGCGPHTEKEWRQLVESGALDEKPGGAESTRGQKRTRR